MNPVTKIKRTIAVLHLPKPAQAVSAHAKTILAGLEDNPSVFVTPSPPLATFKADIAALDSAETYALGRTKGAAEARNAKLDVVMEDLREAKAYVNRIANADPANAAAIITAAQLSVKTAFSVHKQVLGARQGPSSGIVLLVAKAVARKAAYFWQWSLDQKAWTDLPITLVARTSVANLTPVMIHGFRFRTYASGAYSDWSDVVTIIVH